MMKGKVLIPQQSNIVGGEMMEKNLHTCLITRHSQFPTVCIYCDKQILPNDLHYVEKGKTEHIHSLIARKYCEDCYKKYGEQLLLKGEKK
jgi:hypothetical protein